MREYKYANVAVSEPNNPIESHQYPYGLVTKKLCIAGLVASWCCGITCLVAGGILFQGSGGDALHITLPSRIVKEIIPLAINIVITILIEALGLIHSVTLRWTLGKRLTFNSNLRLFTACPLRLGLGRISNLLQAFFLVLSYCAAGFIFAGYPPQQLCDATSSPGYPPLGVNGGQCKDGREGGVYPLSLIAMGIGITGQAILASVQMAIYRPPTWSTSPVETAWAAVANGVMVHQQYRCLHSVHDAKKAAGPISPQERQSCAWRAHPEVKRILIYLWILVLFTIAWFGGLYGAIEKAWRDCNQNDGTYRYCGVYHGSSWSLLPDTVGATSLANINAVDFDSNTPDWSRSFGLILMLAIVMGFQSFLTMGLHCMELLVTLSRDEDTWRKAYSPTGLQPTNAFTNSLKSWKSVVLFLLKAGIHWLFGLGITYYIRFGIFMRPPQILYLSFGLIVLAFLGTYLCFVKPKGPQPANFGHLQTLADSIDEWHLTVFWGHKGVREDGVCQAGTSDHQLEKIRLDQVYA